jgi:ABC-type glutathione transport system ATPase component
MMHAGDIDVLKVESLSIALNQDRERIGIVDDVSFSIASGEELALVGEGGSGKSDKTLSLMQLLGPGLHIDGGRILLNARDCQRADFAALGPNGRAIESIRGRSIGMISGADEPFSPVRTIGAQLMEVVQVYGKVPAAAARDRAADLLGKVGLPDPLRRARPLSVRALRRHAPAR